MVKVKEDLSNKYFGYWKVLKQGQDYINPKGKHFATWECLCTGCNKTVREVKQADLKNNKSTACGCIMPIRKNLLGQTFGRLTVLKLTNPYIHSDGRKETQWLCKCECGNIVEVTTTKLTTGNTKSCGCLNFDLAKKRIKEYNQLVYHDNEYDLTGNYGIGYTINSHVPFFFDLKDYNKIKSIHWRESNSGYIEGFMDNKMVRMHQFITDFKYPQIDHKNRKRYDNRQENLRQATSSENARNRSNIPHSSPYIGVVWDSHGPNWRARIRINNKETYLGGYDTIQEALIMRLKAEKQYYGEFAPQRDLFKLYNI